MSISQILLRKILPDNRMGSILLPVVLLFFTEVQNLPAQTFHFVDASASFGALRDAQSEDSGPAWGDFNNDGWQDLYIAAFETNSLYRNNGDGTFDEVAGQAGVADATKAKAATWGDIDNDGFLDLYISADEDEPNTLYRNNGDETFTEIGAAAGVDDSSFAQGGAWADFDRDGRLDYFLLQDDVANILFRNNGNLTFSDVTGAAGVVNDWAAYGISWLDYDNDAHPDLFVANCRNLNGNSWTNLLYRNNGDGTFTDVSSETGVDYQGKSWGVAAFDFDNDLDIDVLVVNEDPTDSFLLYENRSGVFTEISEEAGLDDELPALAVTYGDYDNDGDIDIITAGFNPANRLYENRGDGTFRDASAGAPFPALPNPRFTSAATADYDNDGWPDFVIADERSRAYVFHNQAPAAAQDNHWLQVRLEGVQNNRFGIGAKVTVVSADLKQVRYVEAGSGTYSQNMLPVHFGLAGRSEIDSLTIAWPGGVQDVLTGIPADTILDVREGSTTTGVAGQPAQPSDFHLQQNYPNPFNPSTTIVYQVPETGAKTPVTLEIYDTLGRKVRTLVRTSQTSGRYSVIWNGANDASEQVASGVYLYRLRVGEHGEVKRMVLLR